MLIAGTQMHIITFFFVSIELVILFYLIIYKLARPDDKSAVLNIVLITLLIVYNVTGGLLPDSGLPGSVFIQEVIAYATGFITPCFFPFYVYKAFGLNKMKFHAYRGVFLFLIGPFIIFVIVYAISNNLETAKNLLILPVIYGLWVTYSLVKAINYKYGNNFSSKASKEEITVLLLSISPWIGLPVISYFDLSQAIEASITNPGFLLLLALQVSRHIKQFRTEHQRLVESEFNLINWNENLQAEVNKRTRELEKINEQKTNAFVNLAHETKTPLTLINNYLEEYIYNNSNSEELSIVKKNMDKLSMDIVNFFDMEKFNKGFAVYNNSQVSNFSEILTENLILFKEYSRKRNIQIQENIAGNVFIKADPVAISRVINNLIENAIKFSIGGGIIGVSLQGVNDKIIFSVKDCGEGIPTEMQKKIFEPYYQITNRKASNQGMGLGLPIVKKIIDDLNGEIHIKSDPKKEPGTDVTVSLNKCKDVTEEVATKNKHVSILSDPREVKINESVHHLNRQTILLVEDNTSMINYLLKKLEEKYNVYTALNGNEALKKLKSFSVNPDLIISDIMMDQLDGYEFAKIISKNPLYNHIPFIFVSAKSSRNDKLDGLKLGAIDFIQKPFLINELLQKVKSVLNNAEKQKQAIITRAFDGINNSEIVKQKTSTDIFNENCVFYKITSREKDIVKLIVEGYTYKNIGATLFISERTVSKHVQNIFEKLHVSNKIELINKLETA